MMATRRRKRLFPAKPRPLLQRQPLAGATLAFLVTLFFVLLILLFSLPSSPPSRYIDTRSSPSPPPPHCGAATLGEFGDMMLSMLPKNLAFTAFVPSPESFRHILKLGPNDSVAEGKASDTYAIVSRVLGFSAVPQRLLSADVPVREHARLLDSVSGLRIYGWRDVGGALVVNGVRSECVDIIRDQIVVHVMAGVLMDTEFEQYFSSGSDD